MSLYMAGYQSREFCSFFFLSSMQVCCGKYFFPRVSVHNYYCTFYLRSNAQVEMRTLWKLGYLLNMLPGCQVILPSLLLATLEKFFNLALNKVCRED